MNVERLWLLGQESGFNMSALGGGAAGELGRVREGWCVVGRDRLMTRKDKYAWRPWVKRSIMCARERGVHTSEAGE